MESTKFIKSSKSKKQSKRLNAQFSPAEKAVLTTILYADIFSFPLTKEELWKYLIADQKISKPEFTKALKMLHDQLLSEKGYYTLKNKQIYIQNRIGNLGQVEKKLHIAEKAASYLQHIPTIAFIGISGGLAAKNVSANDDIDLFIIAQKDTLFITRFWILFMLECMGLRRKRTEQKAANKICSNLLIDTSAITWDTDRRDIYTAREIVQVIPLYERENTYTQFLKANGWIQTFLPNALTESAYTVQKIKKTNILFQIMAQVLVTLPFELLMRILQKGVIKRHQTTEIIANHYLGFHPFDYRAETLRQLKLKMRLLGLLTKD